MRNVPLILSLLSGWFLFTGASERCYCEGGTFKRVTNYNQEAFHKTYEDLASAPLTTRTVLTTY